MRSPLEVAALRRNCDPEQFKFKTTDEVGDLDGAVGQSRAVAALGFAMKMAGDGYNTYVLGRSGSHKHRLVQHYLESEASNRERASDWCYINNFKDARKPKALELPAGYGIELRDDMARLVAELREAIPATFESEHYQNRVSEINQEFEDRHKEALDGLSKQAQQEDISLVQTPHGFALAPTRNGKLIGDEEFEKLPERKKKKMLEAMETITESLRKHIREIPDWQRTARDRIRKLNREFTDMAVGQLIDQLEKKYEAFSEVILYLKEIREDVLVNAIDFHRHPEQGLMLSSLGGKASLERYEVNVIVAPSQESNAPIVYENNPNVQNLLGIVEHSQQLGALTTNFTMIRPGALHRANGGYLILDAKRILTEPYAWTTLKRALFAKEVKIESLGQMLSLVATVSLEPEPIPLDLKVVLIGERLVYYLLCELDPEFAELFKVAADFEDTLDRDEDNSAAYARLIATLARRENLLPLSREAVARTLDHSARLAADAHKLSTRIRDVSDLLREADYWAKQEPETIISVSSIEKAIDAQTHRQDRIRSQIYDEIHRNTILIDTDGTAIGQVNGLSVLKAGSFMFGQPSRITATVRIGDGQLIDIEREIELGGPIHSKGVLIVASYLGSYYAGEAPLSLRASLVFEQSYGGVEGDSASLAETCALLSSLAKVPINQSFAVTGSMNQHGFVQAVGGINEKIEGFFDVCAARGLTGEQAVIIPSGNIKHLMLRQDVVNAVAAKEFNVFAVEHANEALAILTGMSAGERESDGAFPPDSVNYLIHTRLQALAEARRAFSGGNNGEERR
jgi:lon-related putative ATP-dependent protease